MKTCVISHDAGGAEYLSSWILHQEDKTKYVFSVHGPALNIFRKKLGDFQNFSIDDAISFSESIITSTSWSNDIEMNALRRFKERTKSRSIVMIDHWVNYRERFLYKNELILPDEIWVTDGESLELAKFNFPNTQVTKVPNYYLEDVLKDIKFLQEKFAMDHASSKTKILFIGENISENAKLNFGNEKHFGYTEQESFVNFLNKIEQFEKLINIELIIRPHPSEIGDKYISIIPAKLIGKLNYRISLESLETEIANTNIVVGMSSFALYISVNALIRTICVIPDPKIKCSIPDARIERV